jgi:squalene-hopene/tetraprenyl-beta-curcumene cyclase
VTDKLETYTASDLMMDTVIPDQGHSKKSVRGKPLISDPVLETIKSASENLLEKKFAEGYWLFELEADTTIPSEYILYHEYMGSRNAEREAHIQSYLLRRQLADGSWPLYDKGPGNISASVKSYFALKLIGYDIQAEQMIHARNWILGHGGAESSNVFTRITLAFFGQIPWRTVPAMPAEIIYLPNWWLFSLDKVSYWSRCVIVPLLIILAYRPVHNPGPGKDVRELFISSPDQLKHIDRISSENIVKSLFYLLDRFLKVLQQYIPGWFRNKSLQRCEAWTRQHMQGEGGNGAIFPAMINAVVALKLRNCKNDDPDLIRGMKAIEDLVIDSEGETYVQPCVSPVWDTCLTLSALAETGLDSDKKAISKAIDWLFEKQIFVKGDWARRAPALESACWAFQFENDFYPDIDDTSMVIMCLLRHDAHKDPEHLKRINQAANWVIGMQNSDGGWGSFDIDNHYEYLNNIPFADHGALVDPSTADLTARCIEMLTMLGYKRNFAPIARGLEFLKRDQKQFGGWYGRWGVNYIYGTWSVLAALGLMSEDPNLPYICKAVHWLKSMQNPDGGWGEDCGSYIDIGLSGKGESTPSQTAWALLGLIAAGEVDSVAVERGVKYLVKSYQTPPPWKQELYTGTGFPRVFYLRYHGYSQYFPIWALAVYHSAKSGRPSRQQAMLNEGIITNGPTNYPSLM